MRKGWDSNPRYLAVHTLSRRASSTTPAPFQSGVKIAYKITKKSPILFNLHYFFDEQAEIYKIYIAI